MYLCTELRVTITWKILIINNLPYFTNCHFFIDRGFESIEVIFL